MNTTLFRFINQTIKTPFLDSIMPVFSDKDYVVIPGFVALVLLLYFSNRRIRVCIVALALAVLAADLGSEKVLKNIFAEKRPYATIEGVNLNRSGEWTVYKPEWYAFDKRKSNSFPSSHAANVAAVAVILAFISRRTLWITAPVAALCGISRVYTGNHFPADVLAGYAWGGACAFAAAWLCRRLWGEAHAETPALPMSQERKMFLWVLGLWTFINFSFVYINSFELAGDEAQYWDWSRKLALGYYSKPPLIAYLIAALTHAGGHKEWAIRSGAVLLSSATLATLYALTLRIAKREQTALIAVCVAIAMPANWVGSVLMTTDPPLIFFWILAMYAFHRAVNGDPRMWWLVGLSLGLGALAKYTMLVLVISFALYLVLVDRKHLRQWRPYAALGVALLCMSGVLYWNATNGWVSVVHTASIGAGSTRSVGKAISHFFEFFGGQLGVVSPILFGFFAWAMAVLYKRFKSNRDAAYLFLCFIVLFGFYALVSFGRKPLANWPACAYIAAMPAFAWVWNERTRSPRMRKLLAVGVVMGCALGILPRASDLLYVAAGAAMGPNDRVDRIHLAGFEIKPNQDPTNDLLGGRELGAALSKYMNEDKANRPFIVSNRYQMTALSAFYTKGHPHAYCMYFDRRYNQYDLWGGWNKLVGRDALFVTGGDDTRAQQFIDGLVRFGAFDRGELLEVVNVYRYKTLIKTFSISRLYNYSGIEAPPDGQVVKY